jgi:hypothetical protein
MDEDRRRRGYRGNVRRLALLLVLTTLAGCNRGGGAPTGGAVSSSENGLSLTVSFDGPLRTGEPVTWTLALENRGQQALTLRFPSGKEGDVALRRGDREVYRWSANRVFSQAIRDMALPAGARHTFRLEERALPAPAGEYELVAEVAADPSPGAVRRPVTVR